MNTPFVSSIDAGQVCLLNIDPELKTRIKKEGFRIRKKSRTGSRRQAEEYILFEPSEVRVFSYKSGVLESQELVRICLYLNKEGLPFRKNFKMDFSPSDYMTH